jgi:pimeloyl-ACP methyl ester carboxylesterase
MDATRKFINSDAGYAVMRANQANIRANSAENYSAFIEALLKWVRCQPGQEQEPKFTALLASIKAPTLVVTSDNDHLIPRELSELSERLRCEARGDAGGRPFMEQPEQVARIVLDFVAGLRR